MIQRSRPEARVNVQATVLKELRDMADDLYSHGDSHDPSEIWKQKSSYLDGFVKAGILFDIVKMDTIQDVIDASHLRRFGESREERGLRQSAKLESHDEQSFDWDKFDSPAVDRVQVVRSMIAGKWALVQWLKPMHRTRYTKVLTTNRMQ